MIHLLLLMLERVSLLIIVAFLVSRMRSFRQMLDNQYGVKEQFFMILLFGAFGVISNYTGIVIRGNDLVFSQVWQNNLAADSAIANTRVLGVAIGGLFGGPVVGLSVGLIAGVHRLALGGFTAVACGVSTILSGLVTGLIGLRFNKRSNQALGFIVMIGILMECVQMGIILAIAKPFTAAWELVQVISIPMIIVNGFGMLVFMLIIQTIMQEEERTRALQTNQALYIADQTLPFFRQGLNAESCHAVAKIILKLTNADAVALTDDHQVLAHVGLAADHHLPLKQLSTKLTQKVLSQGTILKADTAEQIDCYQADCPLQAAIVIPLKVKQEAIGTLKLYFTRAEQMDQIAQELSEGLGKLISTQLELGEAEQQSKLLKDAEIKALQAQVHPHFLFNALNTISALCRIDPEKARALLSKLAVFFRSNLHGARQMLIPLHQEIAHVKAYLAIEQARFPGKYQIVFEIEPELEKVLLPPFTVQPLVENALKHAFSQASVDNQGKVTIQAAVNSGKMVLTTTDNGQGIAAERLLLLGKQELISEHGTGTALYNIRQRIKEIYGSEARFSISSDVGVGTTVEICLPIRTELGRESDANGIYRG